MPLQKYFRQIIASIKQNRTSVFRWFISLVIFQSFFSIWAVIQIPVDLKNVIFLGLSRGRLAVISLILSIDILGILLLIFFSKLKTILKLIFENRKYQQWLQAIALILMCMLWVTLWLPSYRLGQSSLEYERIKPLFLWIGAVGCELFLMLRMFSNNESRINHRKKTRISWKPVLIISLLSLVFVGLYFFLQQNVVFSSGIIEPALTPITPLQLFLLWVLAILVYQVGLKKKFLSKPLFVILTAVAIYLISSTVFLSIPLPCDGDMVGLHPPNNTCYPDIYDSVYDVGALYTYYGEGILNQWFTDKPLYMLFLTICQWLTGIQNQQYLTAQVLFLSLLPVSIFLLTRKLADYSTALLASLLSVITQCTSIILYSKLGGVNIHITATEIFTALLLTFTTWAIFKWFNKPTKRFFPLITGILLGLTILTRFNAILIVPVLVLVVIVVFFKNKPLGLRTLANFGVGLLVVLSPWFIVNPLVNPDMTNPYLEKIQNNFVDRSTNQSNQEVMEQIPAILQMSFIKSLNFNSDHFLSHQQLKVDHFEFPKNGQTQGFLERVTLHFANNLMSGFFSLPINVVFDDTSTIISQPYWERDNQPIWQRTIFLEVLSLCCISIFVFIWGVWLSWRRWGISGLAPLIVFLGYLLGNSFALTSGGRYLLPVIWVIFIYFSFGLMDISKSIFIKIGFFNNREQTGRNNSHIHKFGAGIQKSADKPGFRFAAIALLLLPAIALPFLQVIPDKLPIERTSQVEQNVFYAQLEDNLDLASWNAFLAEENSIIVEGVVFFPQYYNNSKFSLARGTDVFEALVLGKDFVYMSYMWNQIPDHVTDGSEVLVVGCKLEEGGLWGMERRIVRTFAMIQLDNEEAAYLDPQASWTCQ